MPKDDETLEALKSRLNALEGENNRMREQVKKLMAAENKLYVLQDHLSSQQRVYIRLAEIGRELNVSLDVDKILQTVVHFVVYGFNYERCVALLEDKAGGERRYRVRAYEGYYGDDDVAKIKEAYLTGNEPALSLVYSDPGFACHTGDIHDADSRALGDMLLLDEYFVFALQRKEKGLNGFLLAGNTKEQARYQTTVRAEGEMLVAFSNLAAQTAITLANVQSYRTLERERELLDKIVDERTRELSEALDAAHEAVRLKAEFLANVSHELRTPLNSIVNVPTALANDYTEIDLFTCVGCGAEFQSDEDEEGTPCPECNSTLKSERRTICVGDAAEHLKFLKLLEKQGAHLLGLVENVLDFSRLGSGRVELNFTAIDMAELVAEVKETIESSMGDKRRRLVFPKLDAPLYLVCDRLKLKQVLINLMGNAVKFTREDGRVELAVSREGDARIEFAVSDDGIGIAEDQLDLIFESFRQADGSHTRAFGGAGLGLAISKQLVEMHGGSIWAASELGKGSTFRFWLPSGRLAASDAARPSDERSASSLPPLPLATNRGSGRVVVVDDEPAHLSMARKLLEREGYEVQLVSDPRNAVEEILKRTPRFVLLDIMMPDLNGLVLLGHLKRDERTANIPVIVSTAYHYNRKKAEDAGGIWLPKPWSAHNLSARNLEALIAASKPEGDSPAADDAGVRKSRLLESVSRILYVEDEDANYEVTELSLRGKYVLDRARNSKETYQRLTDGKYDIVLMDIQLAGSDMNGVEMCEALTGNRTENLPSYAKNVRCECPIVMVTAYASLYTKEDLLSKGARDMITKPVDFTHLLIVLSRLMIKGAVSEIRAI